MMAHYSTYNDTLDIQDILRASDVSRWTIVRTAKPQSLAEHTFNVVMIARAICKELGIDDSHITKLALEHDLDEVKTGDIPTPAKRYMESQGANIFQLFSGGKNDSDEIERIIIKAADTMESFWFISENGVGRHGEHVKKNMGSKMDKVLNGAGGDLSDAITAVANKIFDGEVQYE